ncbi:MAG TPA: DUF4956 domain-containing protein [Blastocatellia bacterium]|nr:DUF4956 domain-containing protein [Blastocatellia bacterium]
MDSGQEPKDAQTTRTSGREVYTNQRAVSERSKRHRTWPRFGSIRKQIFRKIPALKRGPVLALSLSLGAVVILALIGYAIVTRGRVPEVQQPNKPGVTTPHSATSTPHSTGLPGLFEPQAPTEQEPLGWLVTAASITLKLALSGLLAALLAFRPHKEDIPILPRNPYVAQTQILLAVVAAALMMIVADNAARAFGIFAAASLVRFRTNIRDPKEITVLLMSLAIGLACGVGKIEVSIILALFSLLVLSVLEYYEPQEIFRAMELTVTSKKVEETDQVLRELFERRNMTNELRKVDREDEEDSVGKIVYFVNVNGHLRTDQLSDEIFSLDPDNVESITWDQKKSSSYVYR